MEQSNAKPDPPSKYSGEPIFNKYERWVYESRQWVKQSYIRRKLRVERLSKYLDGRAHTWYMRNVARDAKKWSMNDFFIELFNYSFPIDYRTTQRRKFHKFEQRSHTIREYRTDLEALANSIGGITDRALVVQFWEGANWIIRREWAHAGFDVETATLSELENAAVNYEQAIKVADSQGKNKSSASRWGEQDQDSSKTQGDKKDKKAFQKKGKKNGDRNESKQPEASGSGGKSSEGSSNKPKGKKPYAKAEGGSKRHKLTKEQLNEYRAQGKCFTCASTDHLSKDCPQNNSLKPLKNGISAASVSFAKTENLRDLKDAENLGVFSIKVEQTKFSPEHLQAIDEVLLQKMRADIREDVPYVFDYFGDPDDDYGRRELRGSI
jgi:hypothetical protein